MALLKSLIQRLLDSRTTPAQAANASKPVSGISVEYNPSPSIGIWGQVLPDSIAVSDGYIWAAGRTSAIGGFLQVNSQAMQITTSGTSIGEGEMLNIFIPVSRGQGFTVYARSMNQIVVRLVRTIGGGYNILLRRALSCLRPSFNYLPRSFCKANILTLHTSVGRVQPSNIKRYQRETEKPLSHLTAAGQYLRSAVWICLQTLGLGLRTPREEPVSSLTLPLTGNGRQFPCRKATLLRWTSEKVRAPQLLSSFATNRLNNLQTGGELC